MLPPEMSNKIVKENELLSSNKTSFLINSSELCFSLIRQKIFLIIQCFQFIFHFIFPTQNLKIIYVFHAGRNEKN